MKKLRRSKAARLGFKSVYAKFAAIFLSIWWSFNGVTFGIIYKIIADSSTRDINSLTGIIFINNAVIGMVVILLALRSIVKPIKKLSDASREVASGKFDVSVEIKNQDEIGRLAADFNAMVKEIGGFDKMRREFVSNVSHEFRTPITSIRGFAKLIGENAADAEAVKEYGETIVRESEQLIGLSSNLLRLSELDTKTIHNKTEFALDEQIRQVILTLELLWTTKGIEFDLDLPETIYAGDEDLLRQVWLNLIQNAIKFSPDNGEIEIELTDKSDALQITITDNGAGIAADDLPRVFERFYKNGSSSGNGLGLAIVQRIVEFVGGWIAVESEVGKGAASTVRLPRTASA